MNRFFTATLFASSLPASAATLNCYQNSYEVLSDFSIRTASVRITDAEGDLTIQTQGKESDLDDLHQGIAARALAKMSPEVAAYMDPAHFYEVSVHIPRRHANFNDCSARLDGVFAVVCYALEGTEKPPVTITDQTDRTKASLTYLPKDGVRFETFQLIKDDVGGTTPWEQLDVSIDGANLTETFLRNARCTTTP